MLAGFTTEEAEADTVADQGLKRVNRIFGGLNEGIWPKTEEHTAYHLLEEMSKKEMNSRYLESVAQELVSAMMTNHDVSISVGGSWIQQSLRQHICWRKLDSAKLTSAYLLEETEISNADVSIYVEEAGGSTRDIIITITEAVGTITRAVGTITEAVGTITRDVGTITRAVGRNHHLKGKEYVAEIKSY
ncbi:hypothetical protein F511_40843 [Dorcoceras hygrometricum]|uniref:Uncharacterized protein n=1 Tax=Dorcoceras hygrometricum TaxID=472368 RepID=A0A2Z7BUS8_9LAMI|nr:hypothetical protein F511_40843 [Dorcoceras hygrometricum]